MIVTMTLWIIIVTLSVLLVGLQIYTGVHIPQVMDSVRPLFFWTLLTQSALLGLVYFFYRRANDRAN